MALPLRQRYQPRYQMSILSIKDMTKYSENTQPPSGVSDNMVPDHVKPGKTKRHHGSSIKDRLDWGLSADWTLPRRTCFWTFPHPINPGLTVLDGETIGLPLSHREAKVLFDISAESEGPEGQSSGDKVRTAFTILPQDVKFDNPSFTDWLTESMEKVTIDIGIKGTANKAGVRVQFQGLVLQPPCASNEPLRLTSVTKDALGIMVIVLPTLHTGGDIVFSSTWTDQDQLEPFDTSMDSSFGGSIVTWLIDPNLEVELGPIESGCRVMLVYDLLTSEEAQVPTEALIHKNEHLLRRALLDLKRFPSVTGQVSGVVAHILRNTSKLGKVTEIDALGALEDEDPAVVAEILKKTADEEDGLKSGPVIDKINRADRDLVEAFWKLCNETGMFFYLAKIKLRFDARDLSQEFTPRPSSILLTEVRDMFSSKMAKFINIHPTNLFAEMSLDMGSWKGARGRNGEDLAIFDGVAMLMIVPNCYPPFLLNPDNFGKMNAGMWLQNWNQQAEEESDGLTIEQIRHACRYITAEQVAYEDGTKDFLEAPFDGPVMEQVIRASLLTGELDLSFNLEKLTWQSHFTIGEFIAKHGFGAVERSLSFSISKLQRIESRRTILNELETTVNAQVGTESNMTRATILSWRAGQALDALRDCTFETDEDARCLVFMGGRYGSMYLISRVLETVKKHAKKTAFVLCFLNHLGSGSGTLDIPQDAVRLSYQIIIPQIMSDLWLREDARETSFTGQGAANNGSARRPSQEFMSKHIADLLCYCVQFKVDDMLAGLVRQLLAEGCSKTIDYGDDFEKIYLPFLTYLYEILKVLQITQTEGWKDAKVFEDAHLQKLFRKLITSHLIKLRSPNPPLPEHPTNWVKAKKGCPDPLCQDCRKLDRFLQNDTKIRVEYKVHTQKRKHLEEQFGGLVDVANTLQGYTGKGKNDKDFSFRFLEIPYPGILIIEKSHKNFESRVKIWGQKCTRALDIIKKELVKKGAKELLGDCVTLMNDMRRVVNLKVTISEAQLQLSNREADAMRHSRR